MRQKTHEILMILCIGLLLPSVAITKEPSQTVSADNIQVLKISAQDERAIIKTPDGKMQVIKVGDVIGAEGSRVPSGKEKKSVTSYELRVVEIAAGRVVIEEKKGEETEKIIIRLVDGKQKVERIKKTGDKQPMLLAPPEKDKKNQENKKSPENKNSFY